MQYIVVAATAIIGAVVSLLFRRIEKKIDAIEDANERHHAEQVEVRIAERELLLAEAHVSALTARCVRGEKVNGELEKAEHEVEAKTKVLEGITNRMFVEHTMEV